MAHSARIFVAIAVSKPEKLTELPGALTAGRRMAAWAQKQGYLVCHIDDARDKKVTIARIERAVVKAIESVTETQTLERIVFFFAGHGAAQTLNDAYWLLSRWHSKTSEAVKVPHLLRMLRYYHPQQVSIMSDACRVVHPSFLDTIGSAVLPRPDEDPVDHELDQFFAVDVGEAAFMVRAPDADDDFCIFTEVVLDALEGAASSAFDPSRNDGSVVTSGSLAAYLKATLPMEASKHNVVMKPQPQPGFYADPVYARFDQPPRLYPRAARLRSDDDDPITTQDFGLGGRPRATDDRFELVLVEVAKDEKAKAVEDAISDQPRPNADWRAGVIVTGQTVVACETLTSGAAYEVDPGAFSIDIPAGFDGQSCADVLVTLESGRVAYVCAVRGYIASIAFYEEAAASVIYRPVRRAPEADLETKIKLIAQLNAGLLTGECATDAAARIRSDKHWDFTMGCIAAYLYDSVGDIESVRRTAYYYANAEQLVPLDVALLSGGLIRRGEDGLLRVDIPATRRRAPRTEAEAERRYTYRETESIEHALVGGQLPWMSKGWDAVATARLSPGLASWRDQILQIASDMPRSPFALVNPHAAALVRQLVGRAAIANA